MPKSQMSRPEPGSIEDRERIFYKFIFKKKTLLWTFLYWLGFSIFAGHLVYLERYTAALAYFIIITLCFGLSVYIADSGIGMLLFVAYRVGELIYLPFLVKNSNVILERQSREEFGLEPVR